MFFSDLKNAGALRAIKSAFTSLFYGCRFPLQLGVVLVFLIDWKQAYLTITKPYTHPLQNDKISTTPNIWWPFDLACHWTMLQQILLYIFWCGIFIWTFWVLICQNLLKLSQDIDENVLHTSIVNLLKWAKMWLFLKSTIFK